jgi:excisionase family DNA binding protein
VSYSGHDYLTAAEAARLLQMSIRTITRWANAGRLPYAVVGGEKRFAREDLQAIATLPRDPDTYDGTSHRHA